MTAKTVGFAISDELRPALKEVVDHFGGGNQSEFLRIAVRDYQVRLRWTRMNELRHGARAERAGRTYNSQEVLDLIRQEEIPDES